MSERGKVADVLGERWSLLRPEYARLVGKGEWVSGRSYIDEIRVGGGVY